MPQANRTPNPGSERMGSLAITVKLFALACLFRNAEMVFATLDVTWCQ
jgi:hypothetical protein